MSDWKPGDLALCVKGGPYSATAWALDGFPIAGQKYTVAHYGNAEFFPGIFPALCFWDGPRNASGERIWGAYRFVKITPPKADEFDREVIELMAGKPAKAPA